MSFKATIDTFFLHSQSIVEIKTVSHLQLFSITPATDWANATNAISTSGPQDSAIASAVTNLKNVQGIPNALNSFKKRDFTGNLTGSGARQHFSTECRNFTSNKTYEYRDVERTALEETFAGVLEPRVWVGENSWKK